MRIGIGLGIAYNRKRPPASGGSPTPTPTPAPSWSVQPSITGTPTVGQTLNGLDGTIVNGTISARAWLRAGTPISGATGATYLLDALDEGELISFQVTATGAGGSNSATSPTVGPVDDAFVAPAIPTPVITKQSASGDPLAFSIDGAGYLIGYYIRLQLAGNSGFTTNYPGEGAIRDDNRILTIEDFTDDDLNGTVEMNALSGLIGQNAGTAYLRICYGQEADDGLSRNWGPWSNVISDTVVLLTPSTFDAASKNMFIDLSGGDLTASTQIVNVGAPTGVRSTQLRPGKGYFEVKVNSFSQADRIFVGICNASYTVNAYSQVGASGAQVRADGAVYDGTGGFVSYLWSGIANNDIIGFHYDTAAGKFWVSKNGTQYGDPSAGTGGFNLPAGLASLYALVQLTPVDAGPSNSATINFGATAFAGVGPDTGFSAMI